MQHVVVIGGGFAGLRVVRGLRRSPVRVTLVDRTNHHAFQPLLYQVATGGLSPGEIAPPLRWVLRKQKNASVLLAKADRIDVEAREVHVRTLDGDRTLRYDHLVVAAGARHSWFGNDEWAPFAPGLKTIDDALELRRRIFGAFEHADVAADPAERKRLLTFVVVGAGPTGVELAGQLKEISVQTLRSEYHRFDPADSKVVLVDAAPRVLGAFDETLSSRALKALEGMGIEVRLGGAVEKVDARGVTVGGERIEAGTVVWAAGVQASPLGAQLAEATGAELDRGGRITVGDDFSLPGYPEVRVLGDLAASGLPGVAPVAMQQGQWTAKSIDAVERRRAPPKPFKYHDHGSMATIGRRRAVAHFGRIKISGTLAWMAWLLVHLMYVVGFANRVLVLVRWAAAYVAHGRGERVLSRVLPRSDRSGATPPADHGHEVPHVG
ncbi:MAG: dehydrogenase [Thermoleophilia bacterium]|nr:dehydrogenase [Thermoleophilia bacterium]